MKTIKEYLNEGLIKRQAGVDMRAKIEAWLKEYNIKNYTINDDLTIDVDGDVNLNWYKKQQLPEYIQFGKVTKNFMMYYSRNLISLKGCPKEVGQSFYCDNCPELTTLEGCPQEVGKMFWCGNCGGKFTKDDVKKLSNVKGKINA